MSHEQFVLVFMNPQIKFSQEILLKLQLMVLLTSDVIWKCTLLEISISTPTRASEPELCPCRSQGNVIVLEKVFVFVLLN